MHYLGQYIMVRQLYDKRQQHMVYCGGDQLGELLGLESFSVKDPSPVYEMLKRNLTSAAMTDAAQNLAKEQSVDKPSQDQLKVNPLRGGFFCCTECPFSVPVHGGLPELCAAWLPGSHLPEKFLESTQQGQSDPSLFSS